MKHKLTQEMKIKWIYFLLTLYLGLGILQTNAQTKGQAFTLLCKKVEEESISEVYTYFTSATLGKLNSFQTVTYFRNYEPTQTYEGKILLEHPNGKLEKSEAFVIKQITVLYRHTHHWKDILFEDKGTYKIRVYLNNVLQEVMTFEVKN